MSTAPTDRQQREIDFHREFAKQNAGISSTPVEMDVVHEKKRRWWNAYWRTYDILLRNNLKGKRVLVPGCGFADDVMRLSELGAQVTAFDISSDVVEVARKRCETFDVKNVSFHVHPAETMPYDDDSFDVIFVLDILHHVDIPATMQEFQRVVVKGGKIIGDELYTHSFLEKHVRNNSFVRGTLYPKMVKFIYGNDKPYITEDEHKIDEKEFSIIAAAMQDCECTYFNILTTRLFPGDLDILAKIDRIGAKLIGPFGKLAGGRLVFEGILKKN